MCTGAVLVGYMVGKVSYQGKCQEKVLQLENSQLADSIRHRRRGGGAPWNDAYVVLNYLYCDDDYYQYYYYYYYYYLFFTRLVV